ncbi:MAG: hypothetical protein U1E22_01140 [Coriobacteriia bacterium]|nr:hypothetical protein [Coriobacteriia bacterium]
MFEQALDIEFFTIVLNGEPFIRYHIDVFEQLPFRWHWHVVEGVAELKHDTAWSLKNGGRVSDELHRNGLSNDGTSEYLDELESRFPDNVTVYRKRDGAFWDGKLEMVSAPLSTIDRECLLWEVDADELWTADQICCARQLFLDNPGSTAAYYFCEFFVGPGLRTTTIDTYANNTAYEWLRTWRFRPGHRWITHEPPSLGVRHSATQWVDLAQINPLRHDVTGSHGLVFQHLAYVTPEQLRFKEVYYGYANAVQQWERLQEQTDFPVYLRDYFDWVEDETLVDTVASAGSVPLAIKGEDGEWQFRTSKSRV